MTAVLSRRKILDIIEVHSNITPNSIGVQMLNQVIETDGDAVTVISSEPWRCMYVPSMLAQLQTDVGPTVAAGYAALAGWTS